MDQFLHVSPDKDIEGSNLQDEFTNTINSLSDLNLIKKFNREVRRETELAKNRKRYLTAMYQEFKNRDFDCSGLPGGKSGLSFKQELIHKNGILTLKSTSS